ncbi:AMP-binding protein [Micromonospora inyonensis]|uniref:2-aminobenzoate-CoA ligase n=1 Tax=Micromonospora inyonensis TaxID=47866 RepID=A0A1C6SDD4_9ACTN|nr:AMP-binding protein [Micromonospora inyonensis]SCL27495.1 2-aminobenzoate-CoA ligase [Micromonospora inyonensis]
MPLSRSAHVDDFCRRNLPPESQWPDFLLHAPELNYPVRLNCAVELVDAVASRLGDDRRCLLTPGGETWTYGQLRDTSNKIAKVLTATYGIAPGNRVLLRGPNSPWLVACWLGVIKAGGVVVTTMTMLRAGELATIAEISEANFALCDYRFVDELQMPAGPKLRELVEYGGDGGLTEAIKNVTPEFEAVQTAADDVALLAFTSGTTGRPKSTMHFHRDVLAIADTFSAQVVKPTENDVFVGTPPLAFTFGLGGLVIFPLRAGAASLLLERATPEELADHIANHKVSICFTAPTAYKAMIARGKVGQLASLRRAVSAGEHLPESTWRQIERATGIKLINGIGSTEMLHIFVSAADENIRPGATGLPVPGYVVDVLDDEGNPAPDGVPGRLAVKGPTGCRYLADDRQTTYVQNGWNITGDTFIRDADGYFWYQGRNDDMIVSSGYNIAGAEVEEALVAHPDVVECGVIGTPDDDRGQVVTAVVVLRPGAEPSDAMTKELQDFVKETIAPYKYPRRIAFAPELPKTTTGKLQRFKLRDFYQDFA